MSELQMWSTDALERAKQELASSIDESRFATQGLRGSKLLSLERINQLKREDKMIQLMAEIDDVLLERSILTELRRAAL
jgi:hypothetical protein